MKKKKKKRHVKIHHIVFLIVLLVVNSTAWFIYVNTVQNSLDVHVKAWDVNFEAGENEISGMVDVTVDDLYPGMDDYNYELTARNRSEVSASINYEILEANIFGEIIKTAEGKRNSNEEVLDTDISSDEFEENLASEYPFKITFSLSDNTMSAGTGKSVYHVNVVWPYEQGNDELDTEWGIRSASFKSSNPNSPSITFKIKIKITQNAS